MSSEDQLVSFLAYSMIIYPITNYIVSPTRKYSRWKAIIYAILFLAFVAFIQVNFENVEREDNCYKVLNLNRYASVSDIKKSFKKMSLELHPDKNKSEEAVHRFHLVKQAKEILSDVDMRSIYDRFGIHGVKVAIESSLDLRYIITQLIIHYSSSIIFTFFMTISEPSGEVFPACIFYLSVMLLIEMLVQVRNDVSYIPNWLLPNHTIYELLHILHKIYPIYMNGIKCIYSSTYVPHNISKMKELITMITVHKQMILNTEKVIYNINQYLNDSNNNNHDSSRLEDGHSISRGIIDKAIIQSTNRLLFEEQSNSLKQNKLPKSSDNEVYGGSNSSSWYAPYKWVGYLLLYIICRLFYSIVMVNNKQ